MNIRHAAAKHPLVIATAAENAKRNPLARPLSAESIAARAAVVKILGVLCAERTIRASAAVLLQGAAAVWVDAATAAGATPTEAVGSSALARLDRHHHHAVEAGATRRAIRVTHRGTNRSDECVIVWIARLTVYCGSMPCLKYY